MDEIIKKELDEIKKNFADYIAYRKKKEKEYKLNQMRLSFFLYGMVLGAVLMFVVR